MEFSNEDKEFIAYVKEEFFEVAREIEELRGKEELISKMFEESAFISLMEDSITDGDLRFYLFREDFVSSWGKESVNEVLVKLGFEEKDYLK